MENSNEMRKNSSIFGDFALFHEPWIMPVKAEEEKQTAEEYLPEPEGDAYLRKGEKILSLLRKKERRTFHPSLMLEKVGKDWKRTRAAAAKYLGAEQEKQFLEIMETSGLDEACLFLKTTFFSQLEVEEEHGPRPTTLLNHLCPTAPQAILQMWLDDKAFYVPAGASFHFKYEPFCKLRSDPGDFLSISNLSSLLGELALRRQLLSRLRKMRNESKNREEYAQIPAIGKLQALLKRTLTNTELSYLDEKGHYAAILLFYPESKEAEESALKATGKDINYILQCLQADYKMQKEEAKMEKELSDDYAKSFQTKKNIPRKYIQAMSKSRFNEYFGYVEFDSDCDLTLMEELCREYEALAKELGLPKYEEVSLRFRKLGCHKATGLYYYILKCLCVDVRSPGSFAHEVGHMIDYHLDHISAKYVFQEVYERYEYLLKRYLSTAEGTEAQILRGKTKYNLKYFLQPSEVFARCFEMYLLRIRKIDNSLLRISGGFAYPVDEVLDQMLREFYDQILNSLVEKGDAAA